MGMSAHYRRILHAGTVALAAAVLLCLMAGLAGGAPRPAAAQPRPTLTPTPAPASSPPASPPLPAAPACESICGQVINLENGAGEPGQTVRFAGVGWSLEAVTDAEGRYAYGRLGTDVGLLDLIVPEGDDLHPTTSGIAIAPMPGQPIVVNLGAYRDHPAAPLLVPSVSAQPSWVRPSDRVTITAQVENVLSTKISGVMVTGLLPEGLTLVGVTGDRGDVTRSGQYGAVFIGDLWPGEVATVCFIADVAQEAPSGKVRVPVSLVYREHAAAQAAAEVWVGGSAVVASTSSAAGSATPTSVPSSVGAPQTLPATGPTLLPVTGYGLTAIGVGAAFGAVAWTARRLRSRRKRGSQKKEN